MKYSLYIILLLINLIPLNANSIEDNLGKEEKKMIIDKSKKLKSGYYIFEKLAKLKDDIGANGIDHQENYIYLDLENNTLSYFKWGEKANHKIKKIKNQYKIDEGYLLGNEFQEGNNGKLFLDDLLLGDYNFSKPYRSIWKYVKIDDETLLQLKAKQKRIYEQDKLFLKDLSEKFKDSNFNDYLGVYYNLDGVSCTEFKSLDCSSSNGWSNKKIKIPYGNNFGTFIRKSEISLNVKNVQKVFKRRFRDIFTLTKESKNIDEIEPNAKETRGIYKNINILEVKAKEEEIDFKQWLKNTELDLTKLYIDEDGDGVIFLVNYSWGFELGAVYHYFDKSKNIHVLASAFLKDSKDVKGISKLYSIMRTLNEQKYAGKVFNINSTINLSFKEFLKEYKTSVEFENLEGLKISCENISLEFSKLLKKPFYTKIPYLKAKGALFGKFKIAKGYNNSIGVTHLVFNTDINSAINIALKDGYIISGKIVWQEGNLAIVKENEEDIFHAIYAIKKGSFTHLFSDRIYNKYPIPSVAAFFQIIKFINPEQYINNISPKIANEYFLKYDNVISVPNKKGQLNYKIWNKEDEPIIINKNGEVIKE